MACAGTRSPFDWWRLIDGSSPSMTGHGEAERLKTGPVNKSADGPGGTAACAGQAPYR